MRNLVLALVVGLVTSCMTTSTFKGPEGQLNYETTCNGTGRNWSDCYSEASRICRGKYKILSHNGEQSHMLYSGNLTPIIRRSLIYKCR